MRESRVVRQVLQIGVLCAVLALSALSVTLVSAQDDTRYFEATKHNVSGEFLRFYDQHGGRAIFGYPLTREFDENNHRVQYFQRARMELYTDRPEGSRVQLGLLGEELGYTQSPIPESEIPPPNHPDKSYFPKVGHTVSFAFLEFYRANGDAEIFGYPITEWIIEPNGRIVQYFQRGKMEWYPENPPGRRVQLGMLGTIYVEQYVDPVHKKAEDPGIPSQTAPEPTKDPEIKPSSMTELRMMATLKRPIIGMDGEQTVYVYVLDQDNHGVPGVSVEIEVQYQDGRTDRFPLEATNSNGYSQFAFGIGSPPPGRVAIVKLSVCYGDLVV
jgi:hypothetical protein